MKYVKRYPTEQEQKDPHTPTITVKSAVRTNVEIENGRSPVLGITEDDTVILFKTDHYDNRGNVFGPYSILFAPTEKELWYLAVYKYSDEALEELGWTPEDRQGIHDRVRRIVESWPSGRSNMEAMTEAINKEGYGIFTSEFDTGQIIYEILKPVDDTTRLCLAQVSKQVAEILSLKTGTEIKVREGFFCACGYVPQKLRGTEILLFTP